MSKKVFNLSVTILEDLETGVIDARAKGRGDLTTDGYAQLLAAMDDQLIKICDAVAELSEDSINKDLIDQLLANTPFGQTKH